MLLKVATVVGLLGVVAGRVCEDNGCESGYQIREDCYCDDFCEGEGDCCAGYEADCVTRGRTTTSTSDACQGCPDGQQEEDGRRCWCDSACVAQGDCCASHAYWCGDDIGDDTRMNYCHLLHNSEEFFCNGGMHKAYMLELDSGDRESSTLADVGEHSLAAYEDLCIDNPQVKVQDAITCVRGFFGGNWDADGEVAPDVFDGYSRFGVNGVQVYTQYCGDDDECDDDNCDDYAWLPVFWGPTVNLGNGGPFGDYNPAFGFGGHLNGPDGTNIYNNTMLATVGMCMITPDYIAAADEILFANVAFMMDEVYDTDAKVMQIGKGGLAGIDGEDLVFRDVDDPVLIANSISFEYQGFHTQDVERVIGENSFYFDP